MLISTIGQSAHSVAFADQKATASIPSSAGGFADLLARIMANPTDDYAARLNREPAAGTIDERYSPVTSARQADPEPDRGTTAIDDGGDHPPHEYRADRFGTEGVGADEVGTDKVGTSAGRDDQTDPAYVRDGHSTEDRDPTDDASKTRTVDDAHDAEPAKRPVDAESAAVDVRERDVVADDNTSASGNEVAHQESDGKGAGRDKTAASQSALRDASRAEKDERRASSAQTDRVPGGAVGTTADESQAGAAVTKVEPAGTGKSDPATAARDARVDLDAASATADPIRARARTSDSSAASAKQHESAARIASNAIADSKGDRLKTSDARSSRSDRRAMLRRDGAAATSADATSSKERVERAIQVEYRAGNQNQFAELAGADTAAGGSEDADGGFASLGSERSQATSGPGGSPGGLATLRGEAQMQLARSLQEQGNAEIVRSARLIVRGNDSGEIRLTLRPESLGNVRISLQMQDGHIAGRIIVDNQSVREVFEQNMAALERAFHEGGLETGLLDVSVADSGNQSHGAHERAHSGASSGHRVAERFDASVVSAEFIDSDYGLINMVV